MNKRNVGLDKEDLVTQYLMNAGVKILARNYYTKHGEIDIVGLDGEYLVFFEVKFRKNLLYGNPLEAITPAKIKRLVSASKTYLYLNHFCENTLIRFDCVGVLDCEITWIKDAFLL